MKNQKYNLIAAMKPLDVSEYILLLLTAVAIPVSWWAATRMAMLLGVNSIIKIFVYKKIGNPSLSRLGRWCILLLACYYVLYVISLLYTSNMERGMNFIGRKLPFLAYALCFLVADTSYLKRDQLRGILYIFTATLVVKFWVRFIIMLVTHHTISLSVFDPLHHTYMAMYLMLAIIFLYTEWVQYRGQMSQWHFWTLVFSAIICVAYLIFVQSRTGIAGLIVIAAAIVVHQIVISKKIKYSLIALAIISVCGISIYFLLPKSAHRLTQTVTEITKGDTSDIRFYIMSSAVEVIKDNLPWGVGVGDRTDALMEYYKSTDNESAIKAEYNPHNIYLDSILTLGIPGILLLLAMLLIPTVAAFRNKDWLLLGFVFTVAFSGLFEAVFDRQMGIMYFAFFYVVFSKGAFDNPQTVIQPIEEESH